MTERTTAITEAGPQNTKSAPRISRRNFLLGSLAGIAGFAGGELINSHFFKVAEALASHSIESKQGLSHFFDLINKIGDLHSQQILGNKHPEFKKNPSYMSSIQMLKEAIHKFGKPVKYMFSDTIKLPPDRFTQLAFQEIRNWKISDAAFILSGNSWPETDGASLRIRLQRLLNDEYGVSVLEQSAPLYSFDALLAEHSGIANRARESSIRDGNDVCSALKTEIQHTIADLNRFANCSSSDLLRYFLDKNSGDLNLALQDSYLFSKFLARNNLSTGEPSEFDGDSGFDEQNMPFWRNLLDDCSVRGLNFGIPYSVSNQIDINAFNKEISVVNRIGVVYHRFGMLALLSELHPTIVGLLGATNTLAEIQAQGGNKVSSDSMVAAELAEVAEFLHIVSN